MVTIASRLGLVPGRGEPGSGRGFVVAHGALAAGAAVAAGLELRWSQELASPVWIWVLLQPVVALAALGVAWRYQQHLRLVPVALLALAFHIVVSSTHQALGIRGDQDVTSVYARQGNQLLDGEYPDSEYPVGAVVLFALEALAGDGATQTSNRFMMIPFQLLCVVGIASLRTRYSLWLAAVVAFWPMNTYYWDNRFDLVPTACMVVGLALAARARWGWSGLALGIGTAVKWIPGLSFAVLFAWLLVRRRSAAATRLGVAFVGVFALINLPFLLWDASSVKSSYLQQGGREITNESIWYFPLKLFGLTGTDGREWAPAGAPTAANWVAVTVQVLLLLATLALATRALRLPDAVLLAALCPALFLVSNRVFSPQFILVLLAAWAIAASLGARSTREQLVLGVLAMAASFFNLFVYPYDLPYTSWRPYSAGMWVTTVLATAICLRPALRWRRAAGIVAAEGGQPRSGRPA